MPTSGLQLSVAEQPACSRPVFSSGQCLVPSSVDSASKILNSRIRLIVEFVCSIVDSQLSWRWVFWAMMIFAGACTVVMLFTLPETYAPILLLKKVREMLTSTEYFHSVWMTFRSSACVRQIPMPTRRYMPSTRSRIGLLKVLFTALCTDHSGCSCWSQFWS